MPYILCMPGNKLCFIDSILYQGVEKCEIIELAGMVSNNNPLVLFFFKKQCKRSPCVTNTSFQVPLSNNMEVLKRKSFHGNDRESKFSHGGSIRIGFMKGYWKAITDCFGKTVLLMAG